MRPLALALLLCLALTAPAAAATKVPRNWIGVAVDGPVIDSADAYAAEWPLMADSGAGSARVAFYWSQGQPSGPGAVDFSVYDGPVLRAADAGLDLLPVVVATPEWARSDPANPASPPRDPADYAAFLGALVERYGPKGSLWSEHPEVPRRPVRNWQVWNEPNLPGYWSQKPFAKGYVRLLKAARKALRGADPGARVILAGLPNGWEPLRQIYKAGGRPAFDAVAIHPYTAKPARLPDYLRAVRRVMRTFGDRKKPVWVTELSWPAAKGRAKDPIGISTTDKGQAERLAIGLKGLARYRKELRLDRVFWYTWLSVGSKDSVFSWSGLRRVDEGGGIVSTPAFGTFRKTARQLTG